MSPKNLDNDAIHQIAASASLQFSEAACERLYDSLQNMIQVFAQMDQIEVCPTKQSDFNQTTYHCLRSADQPVATTPKQKGKTYRYYDDETGYFVVPKVLNTEI